MAYNIEFSRRAQRKFESLPKTRQEELAPLISALANDPRPVGAKKLKELDDCYRLRQGEFRIVYAVYDDRLVVLVLTVADRKEVYAASEIKAMRAELKRRIRCRGR